MEELKAVLERVEEKLIAVGKIYVAMQFQVWVVIMVFYYLIIGPLKTIPWQLTAIYWTLAFGVFAYFTKIIWERIVKLHLSAGRKMESSSAFGWAITLSWISGFAVGWIAIPKYLSETFESLVALGIGYLIFISWAVFGMFLAFWHFGKRLEKEMIPAFLIPALAIPLIPKVANVAMVYAGFAVAFAFGLTALAYIYSAFKTLG
ncbi:hypothetical protein E3E22_03240 [Thermococcus sp. MV5]|uniref:hypothetical protein n=1 Tax=Thermococcus sp. MV5 TaxID=1638272 RepID=UPI00143A450A|nr:hypothetical protein [Thermococcus sp. MV5]NJE25650.1 hypothetical protein [Thermococcus sp. MV5]